MGTEVYPGLDHVWGIHLVELRWKVFKWLLKIPLTLPTSCLLKSGLSAWVQPLRPNSSFYLPSSIFISFHPPFALVLYTPTLNHLPFLNSLCLHTSETLTCLCLKHLALFSVSPLKATTPQWEQSFWWCDPPASPGCFMNNREGAQIVLWVPWWRVSQVTFKTLCCLNSSSRLWCSEQLGA